MIVRNLGDAGAIVEHAESKHHGRREALLERNFGCTKDCESIYRNVQFVRSYFSLENDE
jgi:hypothetical protein